LTAAARITKSGDKITSIAAETIASNARFIINRCRAKKLHGITGNASRIVWKEPVNAKRGFSHQFPLYAEFRPRNDSLCGSTKGRRGRRSGFLSPGGDTVSILNFQIHPRNTPNSLIGRHRFEERPSSELFLPAFGAKDSC
jgi:hypothetical protein